MRFAYRRYDATPSAADRSDEVLRPALKVRVGGKSRELPLWGLIDTGADECVLPYEVADQVGPAWHDGVGILTDYTGKPRTVRYGSVRFQIRLGNRLLRWIAVVAFDLQRADEALWGASGFLNYFRITFDGPGKHFTVRLPTPLPHGFNVETHPGPGGRRMGERPPVGPSEQEP